MTEDAVAARKLALAFKYPDHVQKPLEPGVYFGLDEETYHNDPALGSSDMKKLSATPGDFWFGSKFNPLWEPKEPTEAQKIGTAMHKCVLEGRKTFEALYAPCYEPGNIKAGKEERAAILASGRQFIKHKDWNRIIQAASIIRLNPYLGESFEHGAGYEVSIFWMGASGIRKKARIDCLKFAASVDLKSITNTFEKPLEQACNDNLANYRYDMQAEHYREGRLQIKEFLKAGAVHGKPANEAEFVAAANVKLFTFAIIFFEKSDSMATEGITLTHGNPLLEKARADLDVAEQNWLKYTSRFGLELPWIDARPLREVALEEMPFWYSRQSR